MNFSKFLVMASLVAAAPSVLNAQITPKSVDAPAAVTQVSLVREGERLMSQGSKNSLTIDLQNVDVDFAIKVWKDFVKQFKGDTKRDKKADEYLTDNATIVEIGGGNPVDLFAKFSGNSSATNVAIWIDLGGAFVNSKDFKAQYAAAEKILANYVIAVQREETRINLDKQQDELRKLERQQSNLERKNTSLHGDIEEYKRKIQKAEQDIQTNLKQQEEAKAKIEAQKKVVEEVQKKLGSLN